jgi:uncharacterized MAPEG superfamily protein
VRVTRTLPDSIALRFVSKMVGGMCKWMEWLAFCFILFFIFYFFLVIISVFLSY